MRRDVAEPVDAGGLHGGVRVQALCDGSGDEGQALLGQPLQERTLLLDQPVDPRSLLIQEPPNTSLRIGRGKSQWSRFHLFGCEVRYRGYVADHLNIARDFEEGKPIVYEFRFYLAAMIRPHTINRVLKIVLAISIKDRSAPYVTTLTYKDVSLCETETICLLRAYPHAEFMIKVQASLPDID